MYTACVQYLHVSVHVSLHVRWWICPLIPEHYQHNALSIFREEQLVGCLPRNPVVTGLNPDYDSSSVSDTLPLHFYPPTPMFDVHTMYAQTTMYIQHTHTCIYHTMYVHTNIQCMHTHTYVYISHNVHTMYAHTSHSHTFPTQPSPPTSHPEQTVSSQPEGPPLPRHPADVCVLPPAGHPAQRPAQEAAGRGVHRSSHQHKQRQVPAGPQTAASQESRQVNI